MQLQEAVRAPVDVQAVHLVSPQRADHGLDEDAAMRFAGSQRRELRTGEVTASNAQENLRVCNLHVRAFSESHTLCNSNFTPQSVPQQEGGSLKCGTFAVVLPTLTP